MTIIFFGSDDFSIPALEACLESNHRVLLVVTTPDQKRGRGLKLTPTPVRIYAGENCLDVVAPEKLKDPVLLAKAASLKPDLFVVSAYGKFIPSAWLKIPSKLALNVHPSLLPKYRGASPVNRPILNGDSETGVTILEVTDKLDAGDIFARERVPLGERTDAEKLSQELAELSARMLRTVLPQVESGTLKRIPQRDQDSTYADKLTKEEGRLSLNDSARSLERKIRGLKPWPGSYIPFENELLHLLEAEPLDKRVPQKPGTLLTVERDGSMTLATGDGVLKVLRVKPAGKKEMNAADFVRGRRLAPGYVFENLQKH